MVEFKLKDIVFAYDSNNQYRPGIITETLKDGTTATIALFSIPSSVLYRVATAEIKLYSVQLHANFFFNAVKKKNRQLVASNDLILQHIDKKKEAIRAELQ